MVKNIYKQKTKQLLLLKAFLPQRAYVGAGLLGLNGVYNNGSLSKFPKLNAAICKALTNVEDGACKLFTKNKKFKSNRKF